MLPAESLPINLAIAQPMPETTFHDGRILAQSSRRSRLNGRSIKSRHSMIPTRLARL